MDKAGLGAGKATAWYIVPSDNYVARWVNTLHLPYTGWHLSYVALGASLGATIRWDVLGWALLAFFLGLGVAGHLLDLLRGDPLALRLPKAHLQVVGIIALSLAAAIGSLNIYWGNVEWWLGWLVVAGVVIAVGYNLEFPGMHGDLQFAVFWGAFPFLVGYVAMDGRDLLPLLFAGGFVFLTSWTQRVLSTRARFIRRRVLYLGGHWSTDRESAVFDQSWVLEPVDQALMLMSFAMPVLAGATLLWRL